MKEIVMALNTGDINNVKANKNPNVFKFHPSQVSRTIASKSTMDLNQLLKKQKQTSSISNSSQSLRESSRLPLDHRMKTP